MESHPLVNKTLLLVKLGLYETAYIQDQVIFRFCLFEYSQEVSDFYLRARETLGEEIFSSLFAF